jgi:hypothetical protein
VRRLAALPAAAGVYLAACGAMVLSQESNAQVLDTLGKVQADEIVLDQRNHRLLIRGHVRSEFAELDEDIDIACDLKWGLLTVTNRTLKTYDRYSVGVATCAAAVEMFRRDGRLR